MYLISWTVPPCRNLYAKVGLFAVRPCSGNRNWAVNLTAANLLASGGAVPHSYDHWYLLLQVFSFEDWEKWVRLAHQLDVLSLRTHVQSSCECIWLCTTWLSLKLMLRIHLHSLNISTLQHCKVIAPLLRSYTKMQGKSCFLNQHSSVRSRETLRRGECAGLWGVKNCETRFVALRSTAQPASLPEALLQHRKDAFSSKVK